MQHLYQVLPHITTNILTKKAVHNQKSNRQHSGLYKRIRITLQPHKGGHMNDFNFFSPTEIVFGKKREHESGSLIKRHGGSKVLIVYGKGSAVKSGLIDRVKLSLEQAGIPYFFLGGVEPNPKDDLIYKGIDICKAEGVDFLYAVGGGSAIDSAKAIAIGACYDGDFWDFYGTGKPVEKALPVGVILTIAAAGSEASGSSVVTKKEGLLKRDVSSNLIKPKFAILNPQLTCTLPAYQTACGATDIMAHILERYISNTSDVQTSDRICEGLLLSMVEEVPKVIANPEDYQARANIMWAGTLAHNGIAGEGRAQDWNSHRIEHELSGLYDCAHGAGLAVVMPAWMKHVYKRNVPLFVQFATRVFGCTEDKEHPNKTAEEGIACFRKFLTSIGMPETMEELGGREEDIPLLVEKLGLNHGKTGGFVALSEADVTEILISTLEKNVRK